MSQTIARAYAIGLEMTGIPLFQVEPVKWRISNADGFDGLLLGSANAIRHGGSQLNQLRHLPVYAVGKMTARAAQAEGFEVKSIGRGGLQALLDLLPPKPSRLLRLAGAERIELSPASRCEIVERTVYRSVPVTAPPLMRETLQEGAIVALHSARAATHFLNECNRLSIDRSMISIAALAPSIAEAAGGGWHAVESSESPNDSALLALLENMCK